MTYPKTERATRIRIVHSPEGTMIYGNRAAFRTLVGWMKWLVESDPMEHYEVHLPWHLQSPLARHKRIEVFNRSKNGRLMRAPDVEVTFMVLNDRELKGMRVSSPKKRAAKRRPAGKTATKERA
jgi:hypothetical protein